MDIGTYVWFWCAKLELNNTNLRFLHTCWSAGGSHDILVEHNTVDQFCILDRASNLLDNADISKVHI